MKICAIRVSECGRFGEPAALEGLSGRLDLLVAPNEAGKSTLMRALDHALFTRHTASTKELALLRPYGGGAPLVEVELEVGGERWRLRKRFLTSRSADLVSLSSGALARGADAEAKLERLLATRGTASQALLWLRQGSAFEPAPPDDDGRGVLHACIAREIAVSAGGDRARHVRAVVRAALDELVSPGRGQPKGRYLAAGKALAEAEANLAKARAEHARVVGLLDRLAALGDTGQAASPSHRELAERVAGAERQLKEARETIAARDAARLAAMQVRATHTAAAGAWQALEAALTDAVRLDAEAAIDAGDAAKINGEVTVAEAANGEAARLLEELRQSHAAATLQLKAAESARGRQVLSDRVRRASEAADDVRTLDAALSRLPRDAEAVREARRTQASIAELTARLEAAAPTVGIAYDPGGAGRIKVHGEALADGATVLADGPLVLDIEGVGRITVSPGASADRDHQRRELSSLQAGLSAILAATGAADVVALEKAHEEATRLASNRAAALAALKAEAPEGLDRLQAALDACAAPGPPAPVEAIDPADASSIVERLSAELRGAEVANREALAAFEEVRRTEAALRARRAERSRRLAEVRAALPPADERARRLAALQAAAETTSEALNDALRVQKSWEDRAPDPARLAGLEAAVLASRREQQTAEQQTAARAAERAHVEGALQASRQEDVATRVELLDAEVVRARAVLADIEDEVAALRRLDSELGAEEVRLRDSYLAPVSSRLGAYVELVFPGATVELGATYGVEGLVRGLQREDVGRLSDGTREQIAVLVRLAYARLLAEQGHAVPLLLDDALVYSDDHRIAAMHRALEAAATRHQVIVLSCREQAFAGLAANRLSLAPWRPDIDLRRAG